MNQLPFYLPAGFVFITGLTVYLFYRASGRNRMVLLLSLLWLTLQGFIGWSGFYQQTASLPPRILFLLAPPMILLIVALVTAKGRQFLNGLDIKTMTLIHVLRIPVELILLGLSLHQFVPVLMTFEGRNFDIISGVTAPLILYFGYQKKVLSGGWLLAWHLICLGLLVNIVVLAILSVPTPLQQLAFEQPNIALGYFPFVWLPAYVVPVVAVAHVAGIKKFKSQNSKFKKSQRSKDVRSTMYDVRF
jgi:hypothetical protein